MHFKWLKFQHALTCVRRWMDGRTDGLVQSLGAGGWEAALLLVFFLFSLCHSQLV